MLGPIKRRQSRASNRRSAISTRIRLAGVDQRQLDLYPDLLGRQDVDGIVDQLLAGGFDVEGDPVGVGRRRDWCPPRRQP